MIKGSIMNTHLCTIIVLKAVLDLPFLGLWARLKFRSLRVKIEVQDVLASKHGV